MFIKFLKSVNGSDDGINLKRFKEGGTYRVPSDLGKELAKIFIETGDAVEIEVTVEELYATTVSEANIEIIELDEEPNIVDKIEEIKEKSVFKKNFTKNKKK